MMSAVPVIRISRPQGNTAVLLLSLIHILLKTSSLFDPFPPEMGTDTAFLDRMHCYIPGWEIPKFRPEHFTNDYGFITDYLAEFIRELRKEQYGDALDKYFRLGKNLNQRDTIAVRKMVGGMIKLLYPDGEFTKEQLEEILKFALEMRRRVKEQLKKLGGFIGMFSHPQIAWPPPFAPQMYRSSPSVPFVGMPMV